MKFFLDKIWLCCWILLLPWVQSHDTTYPDCPRGFFKPEDSPKDCIPCQRGYFGNTHGLTSPTCSGACPRGTYGASKGLTNIEECTPVCLLLCSSSTVTMSFCSALRELWVCHWDSPLLLALPPVQKGPTAPSMEQHLFL